MSNNKKRNWSETMISKQIAKPESDVRHFSIKVNELERYHSKDRLVFRNMSIASNGSILEDTPAFIRYILFVDIPVFDFKACQASGRHFHFAEFLYFDQKNRIWSHKRFLMNFVNPDYSPIYIHV